MIFLIENSLAMLKAKIFLIETSLSMSKGFLDHNLFHDPNVTTIHRDFPDNRAKDVRISILWPALNKNTSLADLGALAHKRRGQFISKG